jgi:ribose/xylose/arabinose/galactoside ABC-type transport system permease subunit
MFSRRPQSFGTGFPRGQGRILGIGLALVVALCALATFSPAYLNFDNFAAVALQMAFVGIAALGTACLLISGNIDLSIGSMFAVTAVCAALVARTAPPLVAMAAGILLGGFVGLGNGALVWRMKLSPIIITLGSMAVLHGLVLLVTGGYSVRDVPGKFGVIGQASGLGLPLPVCVLGLLAVVLHLILARTTFGRHLFALGGNREACTAVGIPVRRFVISAFFLNGCAVGLSGALAASRFGSASPSFGVGLELDVITAVILGGVTFTGGEGSILGVMLAVALLGVIKSGIVALGFDPHYAEILKGAALIIAVSLDQLAHEARERYRRLLALRQSA